MYNKNRKRKESLYYNINKINRDHVLKPEIWTYQENK